MGESHFYDEGALRHVAINLFNGWGYNFYRRENQLRADDQLVRAKAAWLLGLAATNLQSAEADYRREAIPAPTRAKPFPDPDAVAAAQALERLSRAVSDLVVHIHAQPVPENDRMTERYRREAATLQSLADRDVLLVGQCELLRTLSDGAKGTAVLASIADLQAGVSAIGATLRERGALLVERTV